MRSGRAWVILATPVLAVVSVLASMSGNELYPSLTMPSFANPRGDGQPFSVTHLVVRTESGVVRLSPLELVGERTAQGFGKAAISTMLERGIDDQATMWIHGRTAELGVECWRRGEFETVEIKGDLKRIVATTPVQAPPC